MQTAFVEPHLVLQEFRVEKVNSRTDGDVVAVGFPVPSGEIVAHQPTLLSKRLERSRTALLAPRSPLPTCDVVRHHRLRQHPERHRERPEEETFEQTPVPG